MQQKFLKAFQPNAVRMTPVADMDFQGALNFMGMSTLAEPCELEPSFADDEAYVTLASDIEKIGITRRLQGGRRPPRATRLKRHALLSFFLLSKGD